MLRELKVRNLAIIEAADLIWDAGYTAVTGETGAGKSILLNALKFILGAKVKPDLVRAGPEGPTGADKLRVEALFDVPPSKELKAALERLEIDSEADELVLERELSAAGKNRCRINGSVVTTAALEEIGAHLVDLHGQHQQQSLINPGTHLTFLDGFAGLQGEAEAYLKHYREWKDLGARLDAAEGEARRVREQLDFLKFQLKELDKAPLSPGEEEKVESELKIQSSMEKIVSGLQTCLSMLEGEEGDVLSSLARLDRELRGLGRFLDPNPFEPHLQALESAREGLGDLRGALRGFRLPQSADAARMDELNAKLALIQRLKSKYHTDLDGLIGLRDRRRKEIEGFESSDADLQDLRARRAEAHERAAALAEGLSRKRQAASLDFDKEVNRRLQNLAMEGASFQTRIEVRLPKTPAAGTGPSEDSSSLTPAGVDHLEFFLASNAGETAKPLRQIASGGEISRIMLAIKSALAQTDPRPLLVFDELDTGIGGVTANRVGQALKELADHHQLIVITHLHQVAALASHQQRVVKDLEGGRTVTRVMRLSSKERVHELARMMGDENSSATLKHARELLAQG